MPKPIHYLVNGLGNPREAADLISYILFEAPYTQRLIELGRQDAFVQKAKILKFLQL